MECSKCLGFNTPAYGDKNRTVCVECETTCHRRIRRIKQSPLTRPVVVLALAIFTCYYHRDTIQRLLFTPPAPEPPKDGNRFLKFFGLG